jgi:DNA-binding response OmpR family regulator
MVDDDRVTRTLLMFYLKERGYDVDEAINGEDALIQLEKSNPFLVITDLYMPKMTGIELIKSIRLDLKRTTPILAMSSSGTDELIMYAFDLGVNDIIINPFTEEDL